MKKQKIINIILYYDEDKYGHYAIDIYDYKKLKLKIKYEEDIYTLNSYTKNYLFNINQNVFSFVNINNTPIRSSYARDKIILYKL